MVCTKQAFEWRGKSSAPLEREISIDIYHGLAPVATRRRSFEAGECLRTAAKMIAAVDFVSRHYFQRVCSLFAFRARLTASRIILNSSRVDAVIKM